MTKFSSYIKYHKIINLKCIQYVSEIPRKYLKCCQLPYAIHMLVLLVCSLTEQFNNNYLWMNKLLVVFFHLTQTSNETESPAGEINVAYLVAWFFSP